MLINTLLIFSNFQQKDFAVIAHIKKAFHQIALHPDDRDVCRFLWVNEPNKPSTRDNLIVYRFTYVPFGVITSLFILAATLLYDFQRTDLNFHKIFSKFFYVDILVTSVVNTQHRLHLYKRANDIFNKVATYQSHSLEPCKSSTNSQPSSTFQAYHN